MHGTTILCVRKGGRVAPEALTAFLESNGYHRTGTVMEHGEYAEAHVLHLYNHLSLIRIA